MLQVLRSMFSSTHAPKQNLSADSVERTLKLVEAALQVMGRSMKLSDLHTNHFNATCELVLGAFASPKFLEASEARRSDYIGKFRNAILSLKKETPSAQIHSDIFVKATASMSSAILGAQLEFERLHLIEEKCWLWRGWTATSSTGKTTALPLYKIYLRLGRSFTDRLHKAVQSYISVRSSNVAPLLTALASFIHTYPENMPAKLRTPEQDNFSAKLLQNPNFAERFWQGFLYWHSKAFYLEGHRLGTVSAKWNSQFKTFAYEALNKSGLFHIPSHGLPKLDIPRISGERTNIRITADGSEVKCKLLTDVPLHTSDENALKILFQDIESDLNLVLQWSEAEVRATNQRIASRLHLATQGKIRLIQPTGTNSDGHKWIANPSNPDWLSNISATFAHHGFLCESRDKIDLSSLYGPTALAARELGLPVSDVLNPYLNLLVAEHPSITPGFLTSLQLFDKRGRRSGLTEGDGIAVLHGTKRRRGPTHAAQDIVLTERGHELVLQIIELTNPLRDYLRKHGDGNWRRLILSSAQGFGYPKPYRPDPRIPGRVDKNSLALASICGLDIQKALSLIERTRLPTIRASKAVLIYIESASVAQMSTALGHAKCNERLLTHYLPAPILEFFRERWIRLFQTGIILEALKGSPYRMRAASFKTAAEMDEFLNLHAIKTIALADPKESDTSDSQVMFGLDLEILTLLTSLCAAAEISTRPINTISTYWIKLAKKLFSYIESTQCIRHDIKKLLHSAKERIDISMVESALHV